MVIGLVIVVALAGFNISMPKGRPAASNWRFAFTHPTIALHIVCAAALVVGAAMLLVRSARTRNWSWAALSALGLLLLLLAFAAGVTYVSTLHAGALNVMSAGWAGAIITYGVAWYMSRERASSSLAAGRRGDRAGTRPG